MNFKLSNVWNAYRSTMLGLIVLIASYGLVFPLKIATFDQISPVLLLVVPFLLYGKNPPAALVEPTDEVTPTPPPAGLVQGE